MDSASPTAVLSPERPPTKKVSSSGGTGNMISAGAGKKPSNR
jgi:hypothetical protein